MSIEQSARMNFGIFGEYWNGHSALRRHDSLVSVSGSAVDCGVANVARDATPSVA
jgi:hypothetical protein